MAGRNQKLKGTITGTTLLVATSLLIFTVSQGVLADTQLATSVAASAGGEASSANFTVKSTLGQSTPIGPSTSANFGVAAGFWYQDPIAPSTIGDLTVDLSKSDILLGWSHAKDNVAIDHYVVYRAIQPYFESTERLI